MPIDMTKVTAGEWSLGDREPDELGQASLINRPDGCPVVGMLYHDAELHLGCSEADATIICLLKNAMDVMERRGWEVRRWMWATGPEWVACGGGLSLSLLRTPERTLTAIYEAMIAEDERLAGEGL